MFGTSLARTGEITATAGAIDQSNFYDYQVARMNDAPRQVDVHIVESTAPPAGVGEPGVPPIAPATVQCDVRRDRQAGEGVAADAQRILVIARLETKP